MTDEQLSRLHVALSEQGWQSPYSADVNEFTDEQLAAGELRAADAETDRRNRETLRAALESADLLPPELRD